MSSLYELNAKLLAYEMKFDENGEWINEDELTELQMAKEEKREGIALYIKNLEAEAQAVYTEKENFDERYKRLINEANHLHDYLAFDLDGEEFKTSKVEIKWRKSEAVEILDESKVPDKYVKCSVVRKPLKNEIKKYLKGIEGSDEQCEWARLNKRNNMSIK